MRFKTGFFGHAIVKLQDSRYIQDMSLNFNEINRILDELNLSGMFVQEIVQPGYDSIAIYTYRPGEPKTVYISLAAGACRINETRRKVTKNEKPLRFNEMLRSKIKGARILGCEQIRNERIIKITLEKAGAIYVMPKAQEHIAKKSKQNDESEDELFTLYIRLWSNAGNIFLCDKDDLILDSFYRRPGKNEMKGEKFLVPEPKETSQNREFPVREFLEVQEAHPERVLSFNEKVDLFYSENAAASSLESLLEQAEKWYNSHRSRQVLALEKLKEKRDAFLNAGSLKHLGDLILAYGYEINGEANFIEVEDWENKNELVKIRVDPKKISSGKCCRILREI